MPNVAEIIAYYSFANFRANHIIAILQLLLSVCLRQQIIVHNFQRKKHNSAQVNSKEKASVKSNCC